MLFTALTALRWTRFYRWARLLLVCVVPPYLLERTQSLFPFAMRGALVVMAGVAWVGVVLLLDRSPVRYRRRLRAGDGVGVMLAEFGVCSIGQLLWIMRWRPGAQEAGVWRNIWMPLANPGTALHSSKAG